MILISISSFIIVYAFNNNIIPGRTVGYRIYVESDYAYVTHNDGVEIINTENKQKPNVVGNVDLNDGAWGIEKDGDLFYIAAASNGLVTADVSNPEAPIIITRTAIEGGALNLAIKNGLAFVLTGSNTIAIYNVTDSSSPFRIATYTSSQASDYRDVIISGDALFIADAGRGIEILNVSQPSTPSLLNTIITSAPIAIFKHDNLLFLGCHGAGVKWYNVSNLISPVLKGSYLEPYGEAYGVWGNSTHLYVADLQKGVYCLNISEGNYVTKIFHNLEAAPHDITGEGNYVYLGDQDYRLKIYDDHLNCLYEGHIISYVIPIIIAVISVGIIIYSRIPIKKNRINVVK
nr:LVIVD repeat protein [Candidatus Prometheoarchaeum syntrophicum]